MSLQAQKGDEVDRSEINVSELQWRLEEAERHILDLQEIVLRLYGRQKMPHRVVQGEPPSTPAELVARLREELDGTWQPPKGGGYAFCDNNSLGVDAG